MQSQTDTSLLLTGGTGFVGRNIAPELRCKYRVTLCGRSAGNDVQVDLAKEIPRLPSRFDIVVHAAGKAHSSPRTSEEAQTFFDVNIQGTKNLCAALEAVGVPDSLVYLSSVAVYGCEEGEDIDESHPLNGTTPYALSKIEAEKYLTRWCREHGVTLSILRPSLIAGPNPPGNLGAMISGIRSGRYLSIGQARARKSVLMVHDLAVLVELISRKGGVYNVCGDLNPTFGQLEELIAEQVGAKRIIAVPYWVMRICARIGDMLGPKAPVNSAKLAKITKSLTFSNQKAKRELRWTPTDVLLTFHIS